MNALRAAFGTLLVFFVAWSMWRGQPRAEQIKGAIAMAVICLVVFGLLGDWFRSLLG